MTTAPQAHTRGSVPQVASAGHGLSHATAPAGGFAPAGKHARHRQTSRAGTRAFAAGSLLGAFAGALVGVLVYALMVISRLSGEREECARDR